MAASFKEKKEAILRSLDRPAEAYHDLSPKGVVDEGIRHLIHKVNEVQGLVTTSSCAGRASVFLDGGRSKRSAQNGPDAGEADPTWSSGKGGGRWLFMSHDAADLVESSASVDWREKFGMEDGIGREIPVGSNLVHLKFEPMVQFHNISSHIAQLILVDTAYSGRVA
jgi:tRNA wybutosine-synthesizing protein 3